MWWMGWTADASATSHTNSCIKCWMASERISFRNDWSIIGHMTGSVETCHLQFEIEKWTQIRLFRIQYQYQYCTNDWIELEIETNTLNSFFRIQYQYQYHKNYWIEFETETNIAHCVTFEFWGGFVLLLGVPKIHSWNQVVLVLNCRELLVLVMQFN